MLFLRFLPKSTSPITEVTSPTDKRGRNRLHPFGTNKTEQPKEKHNGQPITRGQPITPPPKKRSPKPGTSHLLHLLRERDGQTMLTKSGQDSSAADSVKQQGTELKLRETRKNRDSQSSWVWGGTRFINTAVATKLTARLSLSWTKQTARKISKTVGIKIDSEQKNKFSERFDVCKAGWCRIKCLFCFEKSKWSSTLFSKCQYNCTRNVLWCQVHSSHIHANHKASVNYSETYNYCQVSQWSEEGCRKQVRGVLERACARTIFSL